MDISQFFTMPAVVETFQGAGPEGDTYAAPVTVYGLLEDDSVLVQTSTGEQLTSVTKFYCSLSEAGRFVPESKVTVNGVASQVSKVRRRDASGFGGPSHLEVDLT